MCQHGITHGTIEIKEQLGNVSKADLPNQKGKLNPRALEFTSSRSSTNSEVESEAGSDDRNPSDLSNPKPAELKSQEQEGQHSELPETYNPAGPSPFQNNSSQWGWESPQGVLPPSPPYPSTSHPMMQHFLGDGQADPGSPSDRANDPQSQRSANGSGGVPPYPSHHPGMGPHSYWGPHHPSAAPYPVYHMYPPGSSPMDRSASPPPGGFPAGGSPPLSPGFISIPIHPHSGMDPGSPPGHHTIMYGGSPPPSLGSSPPGGYYIMHHHPSGEYMPPPAHGYPMQHHEVGGDMATHMAGLSLGAQREGSVGSGSGRQGTGETRASARIARSHRAGGSYNPADFKFNVEEAEAGGDGARTTVMVRNIPNKYTQSVMLAMLDKAGFSDTYDFCYLPLDFRTRSGLGYMFVDFVSSKDAARLYKEFHGKRWDEFNSKKVCEVTYGRVQGRDALVEHFRSAKFPSEDPEFQPLVMKTTAAGKGKGELIPLQVYLTLATPCRGSEGNA